MKEIQDFLFKHFDDWYSKNYVKYALYAFGAFVVYILFW